MKERFLLATANILFMCRKKTVAELSGKRPHRQKNLHGCFQGVEKSPNYFDLKSLFDNAMLFDLNYVQFLIALKVFEELGLVVFDDNGKYKIVENKKVNLEDSAVFCYFGGNKK